MAANLLRAALFALAAVVASAGSEHPIMGVINLLKDLEKKAEEEGFEETQTYNKYKYWCERSLAKVAAAIADEKQKIEILTSKIDGLENEKTVLEESISELGTTIGKLDDANTKADEVRSTTAGTYDTSKDNLEKTIEAIDQSLAKLEESYKKTEDVSLLQKQELAKIQAMLIARNLNRPDVKAKGDREVHVDKYEFKSGNIIEMLKNLKIQFEKDLQECISEETNSLNAHALASQARAEEKTAAQTAESQKKARLADVTQELADANADLTDEKDDLKADTTTHDTTKKDCSDKAHEFDERSKARKGEIDAINKALEILSKVAGVRTEGTTNPVMGAAPTLLQVANMPKPSKLRAIELIRAAAKKFKSKAIERLATQVQSHLSGPFDDVNDMIQNMIYHLEYEQTEEDKHKAWCDQELQKAGTKTGEKESGIELANTEVNAVKAKVNTLTQDIATAQQMVDDITAYMKEATEVREIGKKENAKSVKDAEDAQTAIANAISVLEDFYKKSGAITLVQQPVTLSANPTTWTDGESYTSVTDPNAASTGVLKVLEEAGAHFAKMEADVKAAEATDASDYQTLMTTQATAKSEREGVISAKTSEKAQQEEALSSEQKKKQRLEDELNQWKEYTANLMPACVNGTSTYEDRKQARTDEIDALKSAKATLKEAFTKTVTNTSAALKVENKTWEALLAEKSPAKVSKSTIRTSPTAFLKKAVAPKPAEKVKAVAEPKKPATPKLVEGVKAKATEAPKPVEKVKPAVELKKANAPKAAEKAKANEKAADAPKPVEKAEVHKREVHQHNHSK